ncbi:MAG: hypothetical protein MSA72_06255 [Lachnospiraceae bacterium]|nr:hypothetical protein [Lachnospiraceae bacterium]
MIRKVIWIRCYEINESDQIEKDILKFIKEDSSLAGDIPVKIYSSKFNGIYDLSHIYDMSEIAVNVLKEKYGDENVKMIEREFAEDRNHKNVDERIAEALERIADCMDNMDSNISYLQGSMECLEELTECIVQPGSTGNGKYLRIIGDVTTSDY